MWDTKEKQWAKRHKNVQQNSTDDGNFVRPFVLPWNWLWYSSFYLISNVILILLAKMKLVSRFSLTWSANCSGCVIIYNSLHCITPSIVCTGSMDWFKESCTEPLENKQTANLLKKQTSKKNVVLKHISHYTANTSVTLSVHEKCCN